MRNVFLVVASVLLWGACNQTHLEEGHQDELSLAYTLYTPAAELFVEFMPLIVGDSIRFGAHLTQLGDYKPFAAGVLTVTLDGGSQDVSAQSGVSTVPGIFRPVFVPAATGTCQLVFEWQKEGRVERFVIDRIQVFASLEEAYTALQGTKPSNGVIKYTKEQAWNTDFMVEVVEPGPFGEVIYTSGQILPASGDETTIVAPFAGVVSFAGNSIVSGMAVNLGDNLFSLRGNGVDTDNISVRYATLKTDYEQAKANYDRIAPLVADKIVSERDFLEAKANYEQAKTAFDHIKNRFDGDSKRITAPMKGFLKSVLVSDGQFVESGMPLAAIAQNKRLLIRADVSQTHWDCLPRITEANFITPYDGKLFNTRELGGKLVSYSRNAGNSAYSAPVFFELNNSESLIPGSFIEVYLLAKPTAAAIAIPISALVEEQGNFFVFVQVEGESFEKREVKTGVNNGLEIEILSGLKPEERIVTVGSYQVKLASMSSALPAHSHAH